MLDRFRPRPGALPAAAFRHAHSLLHDLTPLARDCGELCGSLCCQGVEEHAGMYLFPGEECMFTGDEGWLRFERHLVTERVFCPEWEGRIEAVTFVICEAACPRPGRPLACRLFPLAPLFPLQEAGLAGPGGTFAPPVPTVAPPVPPLEVVLDPDAAFLCPLARYGRISQLQPEYVRACGEVFGILAADPLILADFRWRNARWREDGGDRWRRLLKR